MKLITSTDLQHWQKTRASEENLPLLLRRLIINNLGFKNISFIDIAAGDSIWKPGVDGKVITKQDSLLGDAKKTYVIECGQSKNADLKFKNDFQKRTKELNGQKTDDVFIFITTHKWKDKSKIIKKIKETNTNSNLWSDIKTFDADDIENWLNQDFATTAWLTNILGDRPSDGIKSFEHICDDWKSSTTIPIDEDLILARNDIYSAKINQWIQQNSGLLKIKSASRKESLLFLMASLLKSQLNQETIYSLKSQFIIVEDETKWNYLVDHKESKKLIIIPYFGIPDNLGTLIDKEYKIFIPMGAEDEIRNEVDTIYIEPFNTHILSPILQTKIKSYEKVNSLIGKLGHKGTLLHLQRLLERADAPLPTPKWVTRDNWELLLLTSLIGSWNERNDMDKKAIETIFGLNYTEITRRLSLYIKIEEAPVRKNGDIWEVSMPEIIIHYFGGYLTKDIFSKYLIETKQVLSTINPIYNKPKENRLLGSFDFINKKETYYSNELINGICQGYAIVNNKLKIFDSSLAIRANTDYLISELFDGKDWKMWATLENFFPLLAEAAPDSILTLLEKSIKNNSELIKNIYVNSINDSIWNECLYAGILFAMESLAWFDNYFSRAVKILLDLQKLKTIDTKWGNSPLNSLYAIFCPWQQNTMVSLENRKQFLEKMITDRLNIDIIFSLLLNLFWKEYQTSSLTHRPKFIEITEPQSPTQEDLLNFYHFIFQLALSILDNDEKRWSKMIDYMYSMNNSDFDKFMEKLNSIDLTDVSADFKKTIYLKLDHWIRFWEKSEEDNVDKKEKLNYKIEKIKPILIKLQINDPIDKNIQLFSNDIIWEYTKSGEISNPILQTAIKEIIVAKGIPGIIDFAKQIDNPHRLGWELGYIDKLSKENILLVLNTPEYNDDKIKQLVSSFFIVIVNVYGVKFLDTIFDMPWDMKYKKFLLCSINRNKSYWDWIESKGFSELYWSNIRYIIIDTDTEYDYAIQQLDQFKNYSTMLELIFNQKYLKKTDRIKTSDIITVLYKIITSEHFIPLSNMNYKISNLFELLQKRQDVDEQKLYTLEIFYLDLFDGYNNLKPITIDKHLRTNPNFFIDIINNTFLPEKTFEDKSLNEKQQLENAHKIANKLYLRLDKIFPFNSENELKQWIDGVIPLLTKLNKDLFKIGIQKIGSMLANSPSDPQENIWPIKYVRDVIEKIYSEDLKIGISIGKNNSIVVRTINMKNPGGDWSQWASEFRENAKKLRFQYPLTADVLDYIAINYDHNAQFDKEHHL